MKKLIILTVLLVLMVVGCSSKEKKTLSEGHESVLFKETSLRKYVDTVNFDIEKEATKFEKSTQYNVDVLITSNKEFESLSKEEKFDVLYDTVKALYHAPKIKKDNGGDSHFYIKNVKYEVGEHSYNMIAFMNDDESIESQRDSHSMGIYTNGSFQDSYRPKDEELDREIAETEEQVKEDTASSGVEEDTENALGANRRDVYNYMDQQYDTVTNFGEDYVPEVHDSMVANMAARQFGISADLAGEIYTDIAYEIGQSY